MNAEPTRRRWVDLPLHPFLAATLPVLWLQLTNLGALYPDMLWRSWVGALLVAAVFLLVMRGWTDSWRAGAPAATVWTFAWLRGGALPVAGLLVVVGLAILLGLAGRRWARRGSGVWSKVGILLNVATLFLVAFNLVQIQRVAGNVDSPEIDESYLSTPEMQTWLKAESDPTQLPDIYYLLLDGMGRFDVLEGFYGVDTAELRRRFEVLGFTIADRGYANYPQTALSVASSFNMDRLDAVLRFPNSHANDRRPVGEIVARSRVMQVLRHHDYRIIDYPSGYPFTRLPSADQQRSALLSLNLPEYLLLNETALTPLQRWLQQGPSDLSFALRRHQLRYIFDDLPRLAAQTSDRPRFVFAHLLAPHPPFVFGRHGEALASRQVFSYRDGDHWREVHPGDEDYPALYRDQALYVLDRVLATVKAIEEDSSRPAILVLQGDHGPGSKLVWRSPSREALQERLAIFEAYRTPPGTELDLYPTITPQNSFRTIFNALFDTQAPLREDRIFYSSIGRPYLFQDLGVIEPAGEAQ